jgi:phosphoribosylcarboxyaminoimidazole (NCAIR) mutase
VHVLVFGPQATTIAQWAETQAALSGIPSAEPWDLVVVDSDQNWGAASTQLVHALFDEHALAIIALDRNAAHLAEQLALKALVPVIAVSGDRSLTATNVPWIFRMPAEATPTSALRLLRAAERQSGANPERLRDVLASGTALDGFAFLPTGEPQVP